MFKLFNRKLSVIKAEIEQSIPPAKSPTRISGGKKAAEKNLASDPDFYKKIGAKGGGVCTPKGFAKNPKLASEAGRKGGTISRRTKKEVK